MGKEEIQYPFSPRPFNTCGKGRSVPVVIRTGKLSLLPSISYNTRECRPCILPGQHNDAKTVDADMGKTDMKQ